MLYLVAGLTGLRASELERLTPAAFDLAAATATVFGKDKQEQSVTIPAHFLEKLGAWLAGKKPHARLWPGKWAAHRRQVLWLKRDCKRAGLGEGVTFHGLRRKYVTNLIRAGNDVDVVRRMARHKDLRTTLDYYAISGDAELKKAADSLPKPPPPYAPLTQEPATR